MELDNKVSIITGSSRGIGKAIALDFAKAGAAVVINATKENDTAKNTLCEIEALGAKAKLIYADVSKPEEAARLISEAYDTFGKIDILVNNAGITRDSLMLRMDEEAWDSVIDVNLKGPFNCIKAVSRIMMKQKCGSIINMTSVVGITGNAGQANYAAAKAGIIGLTKSTAKELAARNICCNAIAPGFIKTDMTESFWDNEKITESIPSRRMGTPEEVAALAAFLADSASDYITGEVIRIDGGLAM